MALVGQIASPSRATVISKAEPTMQVIRQLQPVETRHTALCWQNALITNLTCKSWGPETGCRGPSGDKDSNAQLVNWPIHPKALQQYSISFSLFF